MREYKFRGKRIDNGEWVHGFLVTSVNDRTYIIVYATEDAVNTGNKIDFIYVEVIPETVGQYTGLNDKNGKEIYEGDVHEYDGMRFDVRFGFFFDEEFQEESYGWYMYNKKYPDVGGRLDKASDTYVEVIGNIHEEVTE